MTGNYNVNGPLGGAQAGCNYQTGAWVWGVEVDGAWSVRAGKAPAAVAQLPARPSTPFVFTTNERWLATARGRLG